MEKNVWLYFNTEADDDSVGVSTNACYNAKNLVAMFPSSDTELTLHFQNMVNFGTKEPDAVRLTLATANTHNAVITKLVQNINNTRPNFNGFITVGDDLTTIVGGAAGSAALLAAPDAADATTHRREPHHARHSTNKAARPHCRSRLRRAAPDRASEG